MKKKKILTSVIISLLILLYPSSIVLAGSPEGHPFGNSDPTGHGHGPGVVKLVPAPWAPEGTLHIVNDPLAATPDGDPDSTGWVIFWCQSKVGFQYNIGVTGLAPLTNYTVVAEFPGPAPDPVLGTLHTDANGLGSFSGVLQLEPGGYFLRINVLDSNDINVLSSGPSGSNDGQGFGVY